MTKEQVKSYARKVVDEFQALTGNSLNEAQSEWFVSAIGAEMCSVVVDVLRAPAGPAEHES